MTLREANDMDNVKVRVEKDESKCDSMMDCKTYFEGLTQDIPEKLLDMEILSCWRCAATNRPFMPDIIFGI